MVLPILRLKVNAASAIPRVYVHTEHGGFLYIAPNEEQNTFVAICRLVGRNGTKTPVV